jgi:hypothetical protein
MNVQCGVPQGSILGPLLFLIYVNDVMNISDKLFFILYADDTNIFVSDSCLNNALSVATSEITKLDKWFKANKLSLNIKKTTAMLFSPIRKSVNKTPLNLPVNNTNISFTENTKFLGVIIDNKLNWSSHIQYIASKISKTMGILFRARDKLFTENLVSLYNTLVLPYLTYCIVVWGYTYNKYRSSLVKLQNKIVRIITFSKYDAHTDVLFKRLNILKFDSLYKYFTGILMYKFSKGMLPTFYSNLFALNSNNHNYNTRNCNRFRH